MKPPADAKKPLNGPNNFRYCSSTATRPWNPVAAEAALQNTVLLGSEHVLISFALGEQLFVSGSGVGVGGFEVLLFAIFDKAKFLALAFFDAVQTPLGAAPGSADRFALDEYENGIGVGRGQDSQSDPTAALDGHVELDLLNFSIGEDFLFGDRNTVHD